MLSGNPLTGKMVLDQPVDGKDISGVSVLFPVMTRVVKLNVFKCGLGPTRRLTKIVVVVSRYLKKLPPALLAF
eukprot:COSAG01_NODE_834_length_13230_cov_18.826746_16_plen_73_part_00